MDSDQQRGWVRSNPPSCLSCICFCLLIIFFLHPLESKVIIAIFSILGAVSSLCFFLRAVKGTMAAAVGREARLNAIEMRPAVRRERSESAVHFYRNLQIGRIVMSAMMPPATNFMGGDSDQDEYCVICLEELKSGDLIQGFPCGRHVFHACCINSWMHGGKITCPVCRLSLQDLIRRQPHAIVNLNR